MGDNEKHSVRDESATSGSNDLQDETVGFTSDYDQLPKGYFYSPSFIGTMLAVGLGLSASTGGFGLAAPNLALINEDLGPDPNINWVSFVYTLTLSVGLLIFGRLTDVFGFVIPIHINNERILTMTRRRYYLIGGSVLGLVGCIIAATAPNVPALIVGMAFIGLAASAQQSFSYVSNELVPMKWRFFTNSCLYVATIPTSGLGAVVSKAMIIYTKPGWRWCYYFLIILNGLSGILYACFYFPPTFSDKHRVRTKTQAVKMFDYVGTALFVVGLVAFQLGLLWGGTVYAWKSAAVIVTIVAGALILVAFGLWEAYAPLKEPIVPIKLFGNIKWVASCVLLGLGASIYYAMAMIWPMMVSVLYTDDGGASMRAGWLNALPSLFIVAGQMIAGVFTTMMTNQRLQCIVVLTVGGALLAAVAYSTPFTFGGTVTLMCLSSFLIGWNEAVSLTNTGIELDDQQEIGTAVGMGGSIRATISTIASSIYVVVLNNRLAITVPAEVPNAVIEAGLPASSVAAFLMGFTTGNFDGVPGLTPQILTIGNAAYKMASAHAYQTVFYTSIAFTGVAVIMAFWSPSVDDKMTGDIAATLHAAKRTQQQHTKESEV
ncbi:hypothetical protein FE257_000096 [Aspergillus nanangensis]|uniref:Major facilitator superfamily (MFS) profile domain-containing protein n=1 Tax=Aspergillus nanangensis TaxID=2582783 RepID=A0AAD4CYV0_ASPNN|nr:hypothetical protein FE257_000096 [Aspergillus nanangensis]